MRLKLLQLAVAGTHRFSLQFRLTAAYYDNSVRFRLGSRIFPVIFPYLYNMFIMFRNEILEFIGVSSLLSFVHEFLIEVNDFSFLDVISYILYGVCQ